MTAPHSPTILITGSRDLNNQPLVHHAIAAVAATFWPAGAIPTIRHGNGRGADTQAQLVAEHQGYPTAIHAADWDTHDTSCPQWCRNSPTCKLAGPRRNQQMIDAGNDLCLAFPLHVKPADGSRPAGSRGTWDTIARADAAGIPVLVVFSDAVWAYGQRAVDFVNAAMAAQQRQLPDTWYDLHRPHLPL